MPDFSVVENGVVVNIVVADEPLSDNWHPGNHGIGSLFDGVGFTRAPVRELTRLEQMYSRLVEIDRLGESPRARREAGLGNTAWLAALDAEAVQLRAVLAAQ